MIVLVLGLILLTLLIYKLILEPVWYWEKRGVPQPDWFNHFFINWFIVLKSQSAAYLTQDLYNIVPNRR